MEKFLELRDTSQKKIWLADHILTQTYPFLKDPKLLMSSLETLFLAYANAIGSLLYYEKRFNKIPDFEDNFDSKFKVLKEHLSKKYDIKQEDIMSIKEIKDIILQHKKSPVEFTRPDMFIICSDEYQMKTISFDNLKKKVANAKIFIEKINNITNRRDI